MTRAKLMWQALAAVGMVTALIAGGPQSVAVSTRVNTTTNEGPECLVPADS